jgi:hypothetical protein
MAEKEKSALEQIQEQGNKKRESKRLKLTKDPITGNYKAEIPVSMLFGSQDRPALKNFEFTRQDLDRLPGLSFIKQGDEIVGAYVQYEAANDFIQKKENLGGVPVPAKANFDPQAKLPEEEISPEEEARMLREGKKVPDQQYAYRQGRIVDSKNVNEFLFQDPVTRQLKFVTAAAPGADVVGGTAEGGVPNPDFAVITPTGPGSTINVVYDATVVQNDFINKLSRENKVGEFKKLLIEKGYYLLANFGDVQTQESIRQGEVPDEMFGIAFNKFLNEYSIANYDNLKKGINLFQIDDYLKNVQPDYEALSAYVPSERDAEQALKATYANYVGRLPSAEELSAFKLALETEAKSKPRVTQPDFTTGMQTTYEGFTADQLDAFATEYTLERPEAEEFGAGQGGLNAISNVFGRIVQRARNEMANAVTPGSL